ncbi:MAG: hypothetical protein V3V01_04400 [Acidimicrobiales bacterium]
MAENLSSSTTTEVAEPDWPTQITQTLVGYVDQVRNKTTRPAIIASRAVVFGLLILLFVPVALVLLAVTLIRGTSFLYALFTETHAVWASYATWGTILLVVGLFVFSKRNQVA